MASSLSASRMGRLALMLLLGALVFALTVVVGHQTLAQDEGDPNLQDVAPVDVIEADFDINRIQTHIETLAGFGTRVTGYEGSQQAAQYIYDQFQQYGLADVAFHEFPMTSPVEHESRLTITSGSMAGEELTVFGLWPNQARTVSTGPDGLEGHLVYAGTGHLHEFNHKEIRDAIVLMDFNSHLRFTNAFMLGARAVIFIEPDDTSRHQAQNKFYQLSVNMPRFYVDRETGLQLRQLADSEEPDAHLYSLVMWEVVTGRNVVGFVEGSDPAVSDQLVVIEAPFDSMSVVPALAPGAEQAVSPAVLLEMARYFAEHPPRRPVLFLATDGNKQALSGIRAFIEHHKQIYGDAGDPRGLTVGARPPSPDRDQLTDYLRHPDPATANDRGAGVANAHFTGIYMLSLELSSGTDRAAVTSGGMFYQISLGDDAGLVAGQYSRNLGDIFRGIEASLVEEFGHARGERFIDTIRRRDAREWWTFRGTAMATSHEAFQVARGAGLAFYTTDDAQQYVDTPLDTPDRINYTHVQLQAESLGAVFNTFLNLPDGEWVSARTLTGQFPGDFFQYFSGEVVTFDPRVSYIPDHPVPGSLVVVSDGPKNLGGTRGMRIVHSDPDLGRFEMAGFMNRTAAPSWLQEVTFEAFFQDPETGLLTMFLDMGVNGTSKFPNEFEATFRERTLTLVLMEAPTIDLFELVEQRQFAWMDSVRVMDARNDAPPIERGHQLGTTGFFSSFGEPVAMIWTSEGLPTKISMRSDRDEQVFVALNASFERPTGVGWVMGEVDRIIYTPYQAAQDMWILNDSRHRLLIENGVENPRYIQAHTLAREHLDLAEQALVAQEYDRFIDHARTAWGYAHRAYPDIRATADDTVQGVLLYMALVLPFAFFMERLLFGFTDIRKQLAGSFGVFLIVWLVLRYIHPAFQLATSPLIILLAFVLMAMSVVVIWIIAGKFEEQIELIRWKRAGLGHTDVGRTAAALAAFSLGVQNMRKRKVRTMLTAFTLIILTFTVLSFMSLQPNLREMRLSIDAEPHYQGVLFRERNKGNLSVTFFDVMENHFFRTDATVLPRSWYLSTRDPVEPSSVDISVPAGASHVLGGLVGVSHRDPEVLPITETLVAGRWIQEGELDAGITVIPDTAASGLGISGADVEAGAVTVRMAGRDFRVIGIFNSSAMAQVRDIDNEPLTPVNIPGLSLDPDEWGQFVNLNALVGREDLVFLPAGDVAFIPYETSLTMNATLHTVAVHLGDAATVEATVREMLQRVNLYIYAGVGENTFVYSSLDFVTLEGAGNVVIPLVIAALIVLNTMLGSVYERTREIEIYNAVGLAPSHIGALFIAESIVYAVIGAVAGYVVGQGFSVLLVTYDLLPELALNYSSHQTLFAVGIIMVTVVASTIYPAKQASRLAAPSEQRTWRLPEPDGDVMEGYLPFTITQGEELAVQVFLAQYVQEHGDIATDFQAHGGRFFEEEDEEGKPTYVLQFDVHLAPYDLGVNQTVQIRVEHVLGDEFDVGFRFSRTEGDAGSWKRTARFFMRAIRKQFLIWRTVDPDEKGNYQQQGRELLERGTFDVGS